MIKFTLPTGNVMYVPLGSLFTVLHNPSRNEITLNVTDGRTFVVRDADEVVRIITLLEE